MTREEYIAQAREILDLWTSSWSEAKWKRWNEVMGKDAPLDPELVIRKVQALLGNAERAPPSPPSFEVSTPAEVVHVFDVHADGKCHVVIVDGAITEIHVLS